VRWCHCLDHHYLALRDHDQHRDRYGHGLLADGHGHGDVDDDNGLHIDDLSDIHVEVDDDLGYDYHPRHD
jgi:hypothetical protein